MEEENNEWLATLTRGRSYTLGTNPGIHFTRGETIPVSSSVKARLEQKAVDMVATGLFDDETGETGTEPRCKFVFRRVGEPDPSVANPAPRARTARRVHN